jgi:hypothetical protein
MQQQEYLAGDILRGSDGAQVSCQKTTMANWYKYSHDASEKGASTRDHHQLHL